MNWINTSWSRQVATATPSPPAVASSNGSARPTQQAPQEVKAQRVDLPKQEAQSTPQRTSIDAMKAAAAQIDSYLRSTGRALQFSVDDPTGMTVVTVKDSATGETIRQIPSEEALRLAETLRSGNDPHALIDQTV